MAVSGSGAILCADDSVVALASSAGSVSFAVERGARLTGAFLAEARAVVVRGAGAVVLVAAAAAAVLAAVVLGARVLGVFAGAA